MQRTEPYETLGVSPDADEQALRLAYRSLVRAHHPDLQREPSQREAANARMQKIHEAWKLVGTPEKRADFEALFAAKNTLDALLEASRREAEPVFVRKETPHVSSARRRLQKLRRQHSAHEFKTHNRAAIFEARALFAQGRLDEAARLCAKVLRRDFRSVRARILLGEILLAQGEKAKALALLEQALVLQKSHPHLRARVLQLRGEIPFKIEKVTLEAAENSDEFARKTWWENLRWAGLRVILRRHSKRPETSGDF